MYKTKKMGKLEWIETLNDLNNLLEHVRLFFFKKIEILIV